MSVETVSSPLLGARKAALLAVVAAVTIAAAWHLPESIAGALLGWITAALLVVLVHRAERPYLALYISGVLIHPLAFYWLFHTISAFGGFGIVPTTLLFALFAVISGLQYPIAGFFARSMPQVLKSLGLAMPIGWVVSEFIAIRIFPWSMGHTQLGFPWFAQLAEIGGAPLISFLIFWCVESIVTWRGSGRVWAIQIFALVLTALAIVFGGLRYSHFSEQRGDPFEVALVQANVSVQEKHDIRYIATNRQRYLDLSKEVLAPGRLIIWPETAIQEFIPARIGSAMYDPRLPYFGGSGSSFLLGTLTFTDKEHFFNSAIGVFADGRVPLPYNKQILMPFGEYTPFGDIFPFIAELNRTAGGFTPGAAIKVFEFPLNHTLASSVGVAPLICYEDVVPSLSRAAVAAGAEVLVNLTNDAWFGRTIAPYQHHMIAAFRSIETRRFLLRSTNSGYTAVVDPRGKTIGSLEPWTEGVLHAKVYPSQELTPYVMLGDVPWWGLVWISSALIILRRMLIPRIRRRFKSLTESPKTTF